MSGKKFSGPSEESGGFLRDNTLRAAVVDGMKMFCLHGLFTSLIMSKIERKVQQITDSGV